MLRYVILADLMILSIRSHIEFGTPVFSGVTSRGLKTYKLKGSIPPTRYSRSLAAGFLDVTYCALRDIQKTAAGQTTHSEYSMRSILYVSLHYNY